MAKKSRRPKTETKPSRSTSRLGWLDGVRGAAVLAMVAYHFGFDLDYVGWIDQQLHVDRVWLMSRALILGSFLFLAGASFALAQQRNAPLRQHLKRLGRIALAALAVTVGSRLAFPESAIYFGTLHAIAVMSLLLIALPTWGWGMVALGILIIGVDLVYANDVFNHPALSWLGLRTFKPLTEDYVPLIPWFGLCLIGCGLMRVALRADALSRWNGVNLGPSWLAWMGRHSLALYLVHQPILLGILVPLSKWLRA